MPQRLHHLDAARAVLLLLGIPFHVGTTATMILSPGLPMWMANPVLGVGLSFIHSFRMSAFFILAGYFSGMASTRRGRLSWLADRMVRVALPLVASLASLAVIQYHLKVMLSPAWAPGLYGWPLAVEHLWFLVVLLGFVLTYALRPARAFVPDRLWRPLLGLDRGTWPVPLVALAAWGAGLAWLGQVLGLQDNEAVIGQELLLRYFQYLPAFVIGALGWRLKLADRLFAFEGRWPWLAVPPLMIGHFLLDPLVRPHLGWEADPTPLLRVLDGALACALTYAMALVVFRVLAHLFDRPSRAVSFLVDGAMAIYLFHMTVTMLVILAVARLGAADWPFPTMQWAALSALVLGLSVLVFLVVRRIPVLALVFGGQRVAPRQRADAPPLRG
ncbi:acyltransferase family protein [Novosphingobium sp. SG720]|uniref:acyltransferase family protein n=1 Tax=Novosphingobium sp. SG720 TaxID=2586998 RepID=UPI001444BF00|nr:acyltransferase family protein [Novosphingobium sp. SG720]NKJ43644.1 glucan biosynthesis protein C [Novosphingobium sp. SG720]